VGSEDRLWAYCSPGLNGLSYRFAFRCDDRGLGRYVQSLLDGLREAGACATAPVEHWYSLTAAADGTVDVVCDGELVAHAQRPSDAAGCLVWDVNRRAAHAGRDHLLFHAAGLQRGDAGVLVPGASGAGKSTLAAGLVRAGFAYLSDELIALEMYAGRLLPYAKPIALKPGSTDALRDMRPPAVGGVDAVCADGAWLLAVGDDACRPVGGPCVPELVVVPRYLPGHATQLTPLSETEAFVALAVNAVNFAEHGTTGSRALGDLVHRCECVALTISDLDEAVEVVGQLMSGVPAQLGVSQGAGRAG
jgi:HprK-related kinase A